MYALPSLHFDLHLHSTRSDGRYPPEEVLARCAAGRLDAVALTDHDAAGEIPAGPFTTGGRTVHVIGGAEVSGTHQGREYHLLVYFPGAVPDGFRAFCREQCRARAARYVQAVENLAVHGVTGLEAPSADAFAGSVAVTRHHLARQLVARGVVTNLRDAFARYLGDSARLVPPIQLTMCDAIRIAKGFGGITSWAHPPHGLVHELAPVFAAAGLDALEGFRPGMASDERHRCRSAARKHGLALTGGSDWHGWAEDGEPGLFRVDGQQIASFLDRLGFGSGLPGPVAQT